MSITIDDLIVGGKYIDTYDGPVEITAIGKDAVLYLCRGTEYTTSIDNILESWLLPNNKKAKTITKWANVYPDEYISIHGSKRKADNRASENRIACVSFNIRYEVR